MQYFSNQINCKICSCSNTYFYERKGKYKGKLVIARYKICMECWREQNNKRANKYRKTDKYKTVRKAWDNKNRDKINARMIKTNQKFRIKRQQKNKILNFQRDIENSIQLPSCKYCGITNDMIRFHSSNVCIACNVDHHIRNGYKPVKNNRK